MEKARDKLVKVAWNDYYIAPLGCFEYLKKLMKVLNLYLCRIRETQNHYTDSIYQAVLIYTFWTIRIRK